MANIINCTPHAIIMINPQITKYNPKTKSYNLDPEKVHELILTEEDENILEIIPPSGIVPRCTQRETIQGFIKSSKSGYDFNIYSMTYGEVENLPEEKENTYYIVSSLVANAAKNRHDLLIPTHMVRNDAGQIIGCIDFSMAWI